MASQIVPLPDGVRVEGFKFTQQGMAAGPYYSVRKTDGGYECAITLDEVTWPEIDGEDYEADASDDPFEGARVSRVMLSDDDRAELDRIVSEHGIMGWDGYQKSYSPPAGVLDMDDSFDLKVLLSDGTIVAAHGYNSEPDGFDAFVADLLAFFEAHQDYSAYYPATLPDSPATSMIIEIGDQYYTPGRTLYKIELNRSWGRWIVILQDPRGTLLADKPDISDYADTSEELPFSTFLDLIRKYDLEGWNQTTTFNDEGSREKCEIRINFENGQEYYVYTNEFPENYEGFRREVVSAIAAYYAQVKG